jgi:triosephosphate isomerase
MLASIGIEFALIGHSERRAFFGETDETVAGKVRQALRHGITPIFCCGETLAERESGSHIETVERQLMTGLLTLDEKDLSQCIIAYEPVWAIGTGRTASPEQAQEMHARIRSAVSKTAPAVSDRIPILYGGSVNSSNAASLFSAPDVDGALVGGASLKADEFLVIVELCS